MWIIWKFWNNRGKFIFKGRMFKILLKLTSNLLTICYMLDWVSTLMYIFHHRFCSYCSVSIFVSIFVLHNLHISQRRFCSGRLTKKCINLFFFFILKSFIVWIIFFDFYFWKKLLYVVFHIFKITFKGRKFEILLKLIRTN
jgi:hypothetical protein